MGECRIYNLPNKAYDGALRVPVEKAGETTGSIELSALQCGAMMGVPDWDNKVRYDLSSATKSSYAKTYEDKSFTFTRMITFTISEPGFINAMSIASNGSSTGSVEVNGILVDINTDGDNVSGYESNFVPVDTGDVVTLYSTENDYLKRWIDFFPTKATPAKIIHAPYVVERKRGTNTDGSTWWYTLWSDKWCEQGGCTPANTTSGKQLTVALPKPYDGTTYGCVVTQNNAPSDGLHPNKVLPSTDSFVISWTDAGTPRFTWHAEGYVA